MLKTLVKIATKLDSLGLTAEADVLDRFMKKQAWKILDTWQEGASTLSGSTPEQDLEFKINYVLDIMFDTDHQFGPGGDLSDMPASTKAVLKRYAKDQCIAGKFNLEDFLLKIRKMFPVIDRAADEYTYNSIRDDLKEIVEIQRRYVLSKNNGTGGSNFMEKAKERMSNAPATPVGGSNFMEKAKERMSNAPATPVGGSNFMEKAKERMSNAPAAPVASTKPVTHEKRYNPNALSEAVEGLPSDSSVPSDVKDTNFVAPQRTPR